MDFNKIFGVDDSYKAPDKIMKILYDKEKKRRVIHETIRRT